MFSFFQVNKIIKKKVYRTQQPQYWFMRRNSKIRGEDVSLIIKERRNLNKTHRQSNTKHYI